MSSLCCLQLPQRMCTCAFLLLRVVPGLWLAFQPQTSNLWPTFCFEDIRSILGLIRALYLSIVDFLSLWQLTVYWTPVIPASDPIKQGSVQNRRDLISDVLRECGGSYFSGNWKNKHADSKSKAGDRRRSLKLMSKGHVALPGKSQLNHRGKGWK